MEVDLRVEHEEIEEVLKVHLRDTYGMEAESITWR